MPYPVPDGPVVEQLGGIRGDIPGYSVRDGATDDGRAATLAVTAMASSVKNESAVVAREEFVDTALCTK